VRTDAVAIRRGDLPLRRLAVVMAAAAMTAAACSSSGHRAPSSSSPVAGSTASSAGLSAPATVVRIGEDLSGTGSSEPPLFDPTLSHTPAVQDPWLLAIYGSLLRATNTGGYVPDLATSATIADPQTIDVEIRENVTFSDGTPFDAAAVRAGILRNRDAKQLGAFQSVLQDVSAIDVVGPHSLRIHLTHPDAGSFYDLLAQSDTFITSPTAAADPTHDMNKAPVGAGPYVLKSYDPNQRIVLTKNPRYWDAKDIHVAEVDFISVSAGPPQVNTLEAGAVDVTAVPFDVVSTLQANKSFTVGQDFAQTQSLWVPVCKASPPLSDVRVRQALSYAIDRNAINAVVLHGTGQPQWALWPRGSAYFPAALDGSYGYNPTKAKQLLTEAGLAGGFETSMVVAAASPVEQQTAQVLQAEWKQIGVDLTIVPSSNFVSDFYVRKVAPLGMNPEVRGGLTAINGPFRSGSVGDACNYDNPSLDAIADRLSLETPGSPAAISLWAQAQSFIVGNALAMWIAYVPYVFASDHHVGSVDFLSSYPLPVPNYWTMS
jgi:ABC-type transport system substrate-binding protein